MTENRITELWNKAVAEIGDCTYPQIITRFAELVATDEREACAKICEEWSGTNTKQIAAYIRQRFNADVTGLAPAQEGKS